MENTYWNNNGKCQSFVDTAMEQMPSIGYTDNMYMNMLICMSKIYYDVYNNGGGNIEDCYEREFNRYVAPHFPRINLNDFIYERHWKVEEAMDDLFDFLLDKPLNYSVHTIWHAFDDKCFSRIEPSTADNRKWSTVTFGDAAELERWCLERVKLCGEKDVSAEIDAERQSQLPEVCYGYSVSTNEVIMIKRGESGYFPSGWSGPSPEDNKALVAHLNEKLGVTQAQAKAMEWGSLFGWNTPGADPKKYLKESLEQKISGAENRADSGSSRGKGAEELSL